MPAETVWGKIEALFDAALEQPPEKRRAWLAAACPEDDKLRRDVERMVAAHERTSGILEKRPDVEAPTDTMPEVFREGAEPRFVGPYRLLREAGRGGMGVVYQAHDSRLDRHVALKLLSRRGAEPEVEARFVAEAKAASALDHPSICTVYDIGETGEGLLYIAMAYYEGETLARRIARDPLALDEAVELALQVAEGLARAHAAGIVHRDVKPGNLMLPSSEVTGRGRPDRIKILDFGIAKLEGHDLTRPGSTPGTLSYMSPEQLEGTEVDSRSDLWSLGVVLYEALTGELPFRGENFGAVIRAILLGEPVPLRSLRPEVPPALERVVEKALSKRPAQRHASAGELAHELEEVQRTAPAAPAGPGLRPPRRLWPWVVAAALVALVFLRVLWTSPPEPTAEGREIVTLENTSADPVSILQEVPGVEIAASKDEEDTLRMEPRGEGRWEISGPGRRVGNAVALLSIHDALAGYSFFRENHRLTGGEDSERRLTFAVEDIGTAEFLRFVAAAARWSVLFDASVRAEDTFTLRLDGVPWDVAVETVLKSQGLRATRIGEVWLLANRERSDEIARLIRPSAFIERPRTTSPESLVEALSAAASDQGVVTVNERLGVVVLADRIDVVPDYARIWTAIEGDAAPPLPTRPYQGQRISVSLRGADLRETLESFATLAGLNLVLPDDMAGRVSVHLVNVPWDNILDVLLLSFGFTFQVEGNVVEVRPLGSGEPRVVTVRLEREDPEFFAPFERCLTAEGRLVVQPDSKTLILRDVEDRVLWLRDLAERIDARTPDGAP